MVDEISSLAVEWWELASRLKAGYEIDSAPYCSKGMTLEDFLNIIEPQAARNAHWQLVELTRQLARHLESNGIDSAALFEIAKDPQKSPQIAHDQAWVVLERLKTKAIIARDGGTSELMRDLPAVAMANVSTKELAERFGKVSTGSEATSNKTYTCKELADRHHVPNASLDGRLRTYRKQNANLQGQTWFECRMSKLTDPKFRYLEVNGILGIIVSLKKGFGASPPM